MHFWGKVTTVAAKSFCNINIGRIDVRKVSELKPDQPMPINDYSPAIAVGLFCVSSVAIIMESMHSRMLSHAAQE